MAAYPYRLPRRYRYPYRRRGDVRGKVIAASVGAALSLSAAVAGVNPVTSAARHEIAAHAPHAAPAAGAIAYARSQLGKPYLWGGTGPDAFDCSGLVYMAYGQKIARTSQAQWATEPHVSSPQPGDLVFFTGALQPGESSPGHVGIVIGHGEMIEAYGTGYPVRVASWHRPDLVGFSQPWGGAR